MSRRHLGQPAWPILSLSLLSLWGPGNQAPDVVAGSLVHFADDTELKITSIAAGDQTVTYSGTPPTATYGTTITGIYGISVSAGGAVLENDYGLAQAQVGTTTGVNQLQVITWDSISSLIISQSTPGTSTIYHAVSFDNQATFKVWTAAAWRQIIRLNSTTWQYNDSVTATPNWVSATLNSRIGALKQAFGIAQNRMSAATLTGLSSGNWASAGGFVATTTATIDFAFQLVPDTTTLTNVPLLTSYTMSYVKAAQSIVEVFQNGAWVGTGWTDNTISGGNRLAQSGAISGAVKTADYSVINSVPGYWYRLLTNGLSASTAISRIRCQAPTQALSNIGSGQPDLLNGFLYQNHATGSIQDGTIVLSDNNLVAINSMALPMTVGDYWYAGCYAQFDQLFLVPFADKSDPTYTNNQLVSATTLEYWTGSAWATLTFSDGTAVNGCTLATTGLMSWTIPADWKQSIPFNTFFSQAYWIRGKVSAALSPLTALSEARASTVPTPLVKYKYVATYGPRLALGNKPNAPDQVDISRPFEEYGFTGDAPSFRLGGQDQIVFLKTAWMGLLVGKLHTFHFADPASLTTGSTTAPFSTVEASSNTPMSSQAIAKGPMSGFDYGDKYGLFFMNQNGFYVTTGLHVDNVFATSRGKTLSDALAWWDPPPGQYPRLDLNNIHRACSAYWANKNWIVTAAPFLLTPTSPAQTTNNRLMVYDLSLQAWLPLFSFPWDIASLTTAYHYNANAPGKLGSQGMYCGDYAGNVYRLFDTAQVTDNGTAISGHATFGYVNYGQMDGEKQIRNVQMFGFTDGDAVQLTITGLKFSRQATAANTTVMRSMALAGLSTPGGIAFLDTGQGANNLGNVHQYRFDFTAYTELYALQVAVEGLRERPAT